MQKQQTWKKLFIDMNELPFAENKIAVVEVEGKKICIAAYQDNYFAFAYHCPHVGGLMCDGFLDANGHVSCPIHRYKFSIATGYNVSGEGFYLPHWPIEQREDGWYIGGL